MRKLFIAFICMAMGSVIYFYSQTHKSEQVSDIVLANIEALASGESSSNYKCVAPFTIKCSQEGNVRVPGYKTDL